MKPRLIALIIANLFIAAPLAAQGEGLKWTGQASLGYRHTDEQSRDPSKLNEYRDLESSVTSSFDLRARGAEYWFNGFIENIGRDDLYLDLRGGQYDVFKYQIYNNELRHNFGSGPGARTPYTGVGTATLTAPFTRLNSPTWNPGTWTTTFDHSYDRRDTGAMLELSFRSPWYVRFEGSEVERKGINVLAASNGTSPGNGFADLPAPIDYVTRNGSAEVGYQGQNSHFAANVLYSKFENGNQLLSWSNGFFSPSNVLNRDTLVLPQDNEMWRIALNGNIRKLPGDSTLAGRFTYRKLTSDVAVQPSMLGANTAVAPANPVGVGSFPLTAPNSPVFNGETAYTTVSLSLSSHPMDKLDTRIYYNFAEEDNNSTRMVFSPTAASGLQCSGGPCTAHLFGYTKHNAGIEGSYRFDRANKLTAGWDYYDIDRERFDFHGNRDHKLFFEYKNSSLDTVTGRLKYQYLERRSDWYVDPAIIAGNPTEAYVRRYDLANVNQDLVKLVLDVSPMPFVDLGFEAIYKKNNYKDTPLGRTDDERQEFYASISFGDPSKFRVLLFADVEFLEYNSTHRVGGTTLANSSPAAPPAGGPPNSIYTWKAKNEDKAWQTGLGIDWKPLERLGLKGSMIYAQTDGTTDFAAQAGTVLNPPFFYPIGNFDNTRRWSLNLNGTYQVDKNWSVTAGYAYERYRYSDIGYDSTGYAVPVTAGFTTATSYVTGQYSFQNYEANIFYVLGTYKF